MRIMRIVLVIVAVVCLAVAVSYPIRYRVAQEKNDSNMETLSEMRQRVRRELDVVPEGAVEAAFDLGTSQTEDEVQPGDIPVETEAGGEEHQPEAIPTETETGGEEAQPEAIPAGTEASGEEHQPEAIPAGTEASGEEHQPEAIPAGTETGGEEAQSEAVPTETETGREETQPEQNATGTETGGEETQPQQNAAVTDAGGADDRSGSPAESEGGTEKRTAATSEDVGGANEGQALPVGPTPPPGPTPEPTLEPDFWDLTRYMSPTPTATPRLKRATPEPTPVPTPTPDRSIRSGPLPYALKDKAVLDEAAILPELKAIYELNHDLVGWLTIPGTVIDYPVVQGKDPDFYLDHDFYGDENINGQIILDPLCDPYTPSYNLILSGHHMKNGSMFGGLPQYYSKSYWQKHPFLEFDSLMTRKVYVIFACFYSADYDEDEKGFRYNAVIDYKMDAEVWLPEIEKNQLYDTGIDREFGDEFITLTTCDRARHRNGRFVVVARKIREGEKFE